MWWFLSLAFSWRFSIIRPSSISAQDPEKAGYRRLTKEYLNSHLPSWSISFSIVADAWGSENYLFSKILIRRHILIFCSNFSSKTTSLIWHTVISASNLTFLLKSVRKLFNLDIKAAQHHVHHWESTSVKYSLLLLGIYFTFNSSVSVDTILHRLSSLWNCQYIFVYNISVTLNS